MQVAVTGSTGLIGTALVASLRADGHEVIRLVRRTARAAGRDRAGIRARADRRADRIRCAGLVRPGRARRLRPPGRGRAWRPPLDGQATRQRSGPAGCSGTRALAGALAELSPPPAVLLSASAIGWYGDTGGREVDESAPSGQSFLRAWSGTGRRPPSSCRGRAKHPRCARRAAA